MFPSKHLQARLQDRLKGLVTLDEITAALKGKSFEVGQTYVEVKRFNKTLVIWDGNTRIHGDTLFVVVDIRYPQDAGVIVTALLRNSTQPSRNFRNGEAIAAHVR